jgi:hypothetical protein
MKSNIGILFFWGTSIVNELNNARKNKTNYNYSFGIERDGQISTFDFNLGFLVGLASWSQ